MAYERQLVWVGEKVYTVFTREEWENDETQYYTHLVEGDQQEFSYSHEIGSMDVGFQDLNPAEQYLAVVDNLSDAGLYVPTELERLRIRKAELDAQKQHQDWRISAAESAVTTAKARILTATQDAETAYKNAVVQRDRLKAAAEKRNAELELITNQLKQFSLDG